MGMFGFLKKIFGKIPKPEEKPAVEEPKPAEVPKPQETPPTEEPK